jgi:hypothetical protein
MKNNGIICERFFLNCKNSTAMISSSCHLFHCNYARQLKLSFISPQHRLKLLWKYGKPLAANFSFCRKGLSCIYDMQIILLLRDCENITSGISEKIIMGNFRLGYTPCLHVYCVTLPRRHQVYSRMFLQHNVYFIEFRGKGC